MTTPSRWLPSVPLLQWGREYNQDTFTKDMVAAVIVTIMLIPQSLAYALLAGLPPEVGLYASVAPLFLYAVLGSSRVLAVGPVAVVSLMTAAAVSEHAAAGTHAYWQVAGTLAFLSGGMLLLMGLLRLGFLANFLSHPVISGFISASGLLIALSQMKTLMGVKAEGHNFVDLLMALMQQASHVHLLTLMVGIAATAFLFWVRKGLKPLLMRMGLSPKMADITAKTGPVAAIAVTTLLAWWLDWQAQGVKLVGTVPQGLPPLTTPVWDWALWQELWVPALLISVVGFVESVSVGQTLAAKRRQRIEPEHRARALERVKPAEHRIDQTQVPQVVTQVEQPLLHLLQQLPRLDAERRRRILAHRASTFCATRMSCSAWNGFTSQPVAPAALACAFIASSDSVVRKMIGTPACAGC